MGGAVALTLAEETRRDGKDDVVGVLTDCAFASLDDVVHFQCFESPKKRPFLYYAPHAWRVIAMKTFVEFNTWFYGWDPTETGPLRNIDYLGALHVHTRTHAYTDAHTRAQTFRC